MNKKAKTWVSVVFLGALLVAAAVWSVIELANKKDVCSAELVYCTEILEVEHSINGLIPIGKDHFYMAMDRGENFYIMRASKQWAEKRFDEETGEPEAPVNITALSKDLSYDVRREITEAFPQEAAEEFPLGLERYLEISYRRIAIQRLICSVVFLGYIVGYGVISKAEIVLSKNLKLAALIGMMVNCFLMLGAMM